MSHSLDSRPNGPRGNGNGSSDAEKIQRLIDDLGSRNAETAKNAYLALITIGKPAAKALVEALTKADARVRAQVTRLLIEMQVDWTPYVSDRTIETLIADLGTSNGFARMRARRALVLTGPRAVPALLQAMGSKQGVIRWEATKALSKIGDPAATGALIKALTDKNFDIRWLAAEGLIAIGTSAVVPLLLELIKNPQSEWLKVGTHHALHDINNERLNSALEPVLKALEGTNSDLEAPLAAEAALNSLSVGK